MPQVKRHVIGIKADKKSGVLFSDNPNSQQVPDIFWRSRFGTRPNSGRQHSSW